MPVVNFPVAMILPPLSVPARVRSAAAVSIPIPYTEDKLEETSYRLVRMAATEGKEVFRYEVGAFLTTARSVKDVLWKELVAAGRGTGQSVKPYVEAAMNTDP